MRTLCLLACLALFAGSAFADDGVTYMRNRGHAEFGFGGPGYFPPYYGGYYFPPPVYGSFYQRPYPTHLDYFRLRGTPVYDYPCVDMMATPSLPEVISAE